MIDILIQDENGNHSINHINSNKTYNSSIDFNTVTDYINDYWFTNHPFHCLLNIIFARLHLRMAILKINITEDNVKKVRNI